MKTSADYDLEKPDTLRSRVERFARWALLIIFGVLIAYGVFRMAQLLVMVKPDEYGQILVGTLATALRVIFALIITLLWTIPLGVAIGSSPRLATFLQPAVQVLASIPATAFFAVILLSLKDLPFGLNLAAILLMLLGTQWYVLFNVIAGTTAIPQDLRYTTDLLRFSKVDRWRKLILPALFPYLVTGMITAGGGAWNASIIAEYATVQNQTYHVTGLGAVISGATATGNFPLLAASTLTMIVTVICINRFFWRRMYRLAEEKYKME